MFEASLMVFQAHARHVSPPNVITTSPTCSMLDVMFTGQRMRALARLLCWHVSASNHSSVVMVHLELGTLLVQLHDHLLLPLVCTPLSTPLSSTIELGILELSRLL